MAQPTDDPPSEFIESVDDMIARHSIWEAKWKIEDAVRTEGWDAVDDILYQLIRRSIAHARIQVSKRGSGSMTFREAMDLARTGAMITRPAWSIFGGLKLDEDHAAITYWKLDNADGGPSGSGWPYKPTADDRAASDWMLYQAPKKNWVELDL